MPSDDLHARLDALKAWVDSIDAVIVTPDDTETAFEAALCDYLEQLLALVRGLIEEAEEEIGSDAEWRAMDEEWLRNAGMWDKLLAHEALAEAIIERLERAREGR